MARYAVGDIQGCLEPLKCLLEKVKFNPQNDQLWLVGDLINRGPASLETLRFIKQLGACTRIVLGNHDLHFLAIAHGVKKPNPSDTLTEILEAPDCGELVQWLRHQPLLYTDPSGDFSMTHAGIPPMWTLAQAQHYAAQVEEVLRSDQVQAYFDTMYGNQPNSWSAQLTGCERIRLITNYFTRMRFCSTDGTLDLTNKTTTNIDQTYAPWFSHPQRRTKNNNILFGHWASLKGKVNVEHVFALDTGCVWGGHMTMMNLENNILHSCECTNQKSNSQ